MFRMMVGMLVLIVTIAFGCSAGGRTTNKYTSLPGGGFHHHGGFLAGYFNFFRGNPENPADSFSDKYEDFSDFNHEEDNIEEAPIDSRAGEKYLQHVVLNYTSI